MGTLFEYHNTGDDSASAVYAAREYLQTFTPQISHSLTILKLKMYRKGAPGIMTVGLYATDSVTKEPTGSAIETVTFNGDDLSPGTGGNWIELAINSGLSRSVRRAIVMSGGVDINNYVAWRRIYAGSYSRGSMGYSNDGGSTWTLYGDGVGGYMFEEWGASRSNSVDKSVVGDKVSLEAIRNIEIVYGGRFLIDKSGNAKYESRYHRNV